ncbi:helix-turn-helix domain-containing protein [Specibacter sp. RAF43]|uniref:helix-turn-helix domain-containing protein n=1 Tax=Specibacter sp. RAF43 TaxID=3233057 RepID=UPI003F983BE0
MSDAAKRMGVRPERVLKLIHAGRLDAEKVGNRWVIADSELASKVWIKSAGRPMAPKSALALALELEGQEPPGLSAVERHRLHRHIRNLFAHEDPKGQLRAWLAARAEPVELVVSQADIPELRGDPKIRLSGVSDPRSGLLPGDEVEAYVLKADLPIVKKDWFMVPAGPGRQANVRLRAVDYLPSEVPAVFSAMDLAERPGPREQSAAESIIRSVLNGD